MHRKQTAAVVEREMVRYLGIVYVNKTLQSYTSGEREEEGAEQVLSVREVILTLCRGAAHRILKIRFFFFYLQSVSKEKRLFQKLENLERLPE